MSTTGKKVFDDASIDAKDDASEDSFSSSSEHVSKVAEAAGKATKHVDPAPTPPAPVPGNGSVQFIKTVESPQVQPEALATPPAAAKKKNKTSIESPAATGTSTPASATKKPPTAAAPTPNTVRASLNTPATISKRPEREEVEYGVGGNNSSNRHSANARKASNGGVKAFRVDGDEPAYSSQTIDRGHGQQQLSSSRNLDFQQNESSLKDNADGFIGVDPDEAAGQAFDRIFAPYIFPRLDADLADWDEPERERAVEQQKLIDIRQAPPNCMESACGYFLATDRRFAIYFLLLCLAIVFTVVSIPTSQIDISSTQLLNEIANNMVLNKDGVYNFANAVNVKSCYTYWGYKEDCDSAPYTLPASLMWCTSIRTRLQAGAAFSIISLIIYLLLFIMTLIVMCCLSESPRVRDKNRRKNTKARWVIGSVAIVCFVMQLICWATIAGVFSKHYCAEQPTDPNGVINVVIDDKNKAYGVGFGLSLTAWCLHTVAIIQLLAIPGNVMNK